MATTYTVHNFMKLKFTFVVTWLIYSSVILIKGSVMRGGGSAMVLATYKPYILTSHKQTPLLSGHSVVYQAKHKHCIFHPP